MIRRYSVELEVRDFGAAGRVRQNERRTEIVLEGFLRTIEVGQMHQRVIGRHCPAMKLVQVAAFLEERPRVEIESTAVVPAERARAIVFDLKRTRPVSLPRRSEPTVKRGSYAHTAAAQRVSRSRSVCGDIRLPAE
jgi:hypothetical protein